METKSEKIHWKKVFNSDYLGTCDLDEGKDLKAVIQSAEVRKIKDPQGKESERNVAIFTDKAIKPMILNVTNCKVIKKFAKSPFINDWKNIPISIYVKGDIKAFGDITEGLRIRETQPKLDKPELTPEHTAWNNAVLHYKTNKDLTKIKERYSISITNEAKLKADADK